MGISPYAAIVIGSKNMLMKVYEISGGKGFRTVDEIRYEYELGKEAYFTRKITFAQIEEICNVLMEFQQRMREYAITEFRCYATSAIRNAKNQVSVLNQIKIRTGVDVIMLSNSELRFLMYKGIQVLDIDFNKIIEKNTAILDIGSGSVQVSPVSYTHLMGVLKDKEYTKILQYLMPMAKKVYVFRPNNERGLSAEILANTIKEKADVPVMIEPDVNTAVSKALEAAQPEDILVACGSLSFMEEMEAIQ